MCDRLITLSWFCSFAPVHGNHKTVSPLIRLTHYDWSRNYFHKIRPLHLIWHQGLTIFLTTSCIPLFITQISHSPLKSIVSFPWSFLNLNYCLIISLLFPLDGWCAYLFFPFRSLTKLLVHWLDCWRFTHSKQAHSTKGMYCLLYTWLAVLSRNVSKFRAQKDDLFVFLYFAHWQSARPTFVG